MFLTTILKRWLNLIGYTELGLHLTNYLEPLGCSNSLSLNYTCEEKKDKKKRKKKHTHKLRRNTIIHTCIWYLVQYLGTFDVKKRRQNY